MRAAIGMIVIEFPSAYAKDTDEYFAKVCIALSRMTLLALQ